ncbi:MAG: hypothetical protein IJW17_09875 [Lentisphaeria bacterium]|nr:hypothetical protein [Lentisphaeria bacterium]
MITAVLWMLLTGLIWAAVGVLFALAPADREKICSFFALNGILFTLFVYISNFPQAAPVTEVLKLAAVIVPSALMEVIAFLLLKKAMDRGSQGVAWSVVQSSMVLSFLGAVFILHNPAVSAQWIGMVLILVSLVLFGKAKNNGGKTCNDAVYYRYVFTAFLLVGGGQFLRIVPGALGLSDAALSWRLPLQCPWGMLFWMAVCLKRNCFQFRSVWKFSIPYAVVVTLGQFCFYRATDAADKLKMTSIVVPAAIGTCIVLFSLYCAVVRKEKMPLCVWLATFMTIAGIALLAVAKA